jgi:CubicO group peptidase (beta-lactamase class C family)
MNSLTRRTCLRQLGLGSIAGTFPIRAADNKIPQKPTAPETPELTAIARGFMDQFNVPGLSVAIARQGKLVYQQGFGHADKEAGTAVTPEHLFRIASVSKPLTSTAIFSLIEQGRLGLDDRVFGEHGRLKFDFGKKFPGAIEDITVRHLLTHTCGGWSNKADDPMFLHPAMNHHELIEWTLQHQPLEHAPGTDHAYSNFGYCILGRLIEKLTGLAYPQAVQRDVLAKCGIKNMRIAGNTLADRARDEVIYYDYRKEIPYRMNVARMDSHGGWIASPTDLVRFAMHVDGFTTTPNILKPETIRAMTTPSAVDPGYACGWSVNKVPNWWHGGSLPGTSTILVRTAAGFCWAALANVRTEGIAGPLDQMMWRMVKAVPEWEA